MECCYACGKRLKGQAPSLAHLEDDDGRTVPVGVDCARKIARAGAAGYRQRGGPLLFATLEDRTRFLLQLQPPPVPLAET